MRYQRRFWAPKAHLATRFYGQDNANYLRNIKRAYGHIHAHKCVRRSRYTCPQWADDWLTE